MTQPSVQSRIRDCAENLTPADRKLASHILSNYPFSGLGRITDLAEAAGVSAPSVARAVQKFGFDGFAAFQQALRAEAQARPERWREDAPRDHILNRFTDQAAANIRATLGGVDPAIFDAAADLLAGPKARLFLVGGRLTRSLAEYFFSHLLMLRPDVTHMTASSATWPHYLVDMGEGDVLVMFDIRRYETNLLKLAELAAARGVSIVLLTDQWGSPIARLARCAFHAHVEIPSPWDSNVSLMLIVEALIAAVQERCWRGAEARMELLEDMFGASGLFGPG